MNTRTIEQSLEKLTGWVERNEWKGYDTFDGLSSPLAPLFTLNMPLLKQCWQQGVRRCAFNIRPLLGIQPGMSTKAMGFFAQGYLHRYQAHGDPVYLEKAKSCLDWLCANKSKRFERYSWGNHFEYQSRGGNIPKDTPTIVWTGLIGHAFMDAYDLLGEERYLEVAKSACEWIVEDLGLMEFEEGVLLRYYPGADILIHNSNVIGASLLARVNAVVPNPKFSELAERAIQYTVHFQTDEGAWYYGVGEKWAWVDSFHTAYVLESLASFMRSTGSTKYVPQLERGYRYFVDTFFLPDGTPRYYAEKTLPVDIQCASQAIQTLITLKGLHPASVDTANRVANWTIKHMQDESGYFYYRKYPLITNKTPTLHWGQATMFAALSILEHHHHKSMRKVASTNA